MDQDKIERGLRYAELKDNPTFKQLITEFKFKLYTQWSNSTSLTDREMIFAQLKAIDSLNALMDNAITTTNNLTNKGN